MDTVYSDHSRIDDRSLAMHRLIAKKVRAEPALLDKARENLHPWQGEKGSPTAALAEWGEILGGSVAQVTQCLVDRAFGSPTRSRVS